MPQTEMQSTTALEISANEKRVLDQALNLAIANVKGALGQTEPQRVAELLRDFAFEVPQLLSPSEMHALQAKLDA